MSKFFFLSHPSLAQHGRALLACAVAVCSITACSDSDDDDTESDTLAATPAGEGTDLSFFVTSSNQDGNLGGLDGADAICDDLATAVGAGDRTWRAYLSTENGGTPIHARSRIGTGPWYNADGVLLANDLDELHDPSLVGDPELVVDETGEPVNGQWNGVAPNEHDVITGSDASGMLLLTDVTTCSDWTSNTLQPGPQVGHTDGMGPMMNTSMPNFTSWNGGHAAAGCSAADLQSRGGAGKFYCFAAN